MNPCVRNVNVIRIEWRKKVTTTATTTNRKLKEEAKKTSNFIYFTFVVSIDTPFDTACTHRFRFIRPKSSKNRNAKPFFMNEFLNFDEAIEESANK